MTKKYPKPEDPFHLDYKPAQLSDKNANVLSFWKWAYSDLDQNVTKGMVGQYIVAWALGLDNAPNDSWGSYDLLGSNGKKIEVKTTSYLQEWKQNKTPEPKFRIRKTLPYSRETGYGKIRDYQADIYILCYFYEQNRDKADVLNLNQWKFWVLSKEQVMALFKNRESITIKELQNQNYQSLSVHELKDEVLN